MSKLSKREKQKLKLLLSLVDENSKPNLNALNDIVKNVRILELNVKAFGYELARKLAAALPPAVGTSARTVGLCSKASTQNDIESDWVAHWTSQLGVPVIYHRKIWEQAYILQALYEHGHLVAGARGIGFGCGVEPLPSYLASHGVSVTVTDLVREDAFSKGWVETNQHLDALDGAFFPHLVERADFDARVDLRAVDMNAIPKDLVDYDFCWSMCALEHLGSIRQGLDFITASLGTLRPGGVSVHTTEFNVEAEGPTIDNWGTVLFQRRHFEALACQLRAAGHTVAAFDFDYGSAPMDRFIDVPPWGYDMPDGLADRIGDSNHLKLSIDGFVATCFGLIVQKAG